MKRVWFRGFFTGIIVFMALFSGMNLFANAGNFAKIGAFLNHFNLVVDGREIASIGEDYKLEDGTKTPFSIVYNGTTYVPIRKVSEALGKEISWNDETKTVALGQVLASNQEPEKDEEEKEAQNGKYTLADFFYKYAAMGKSTEDMYVKGSIRVEKDADVEPGIYDITVLGGKGTINILSQKDGGQVSNRWKLESDSEHTVSLNPSTVRVVLLPQDVIEFDQISKVRFTAVPQQVEASKELKYGEYIVGRDIEPGSYQLDTNLKFNPEFAYLGYDLQIYNTETAEVRNQLYNYTNPDVRLELKDNEIITVKMNLASDKDANEVKLMFNEVGEKE